MIASCGHNVEGTDDLYTTHQIYFDINENGESVGILYGSDCKECFDKGIEEGYIYKSEEECWDAVRMLEAER